MFSPVGLLIIIFAGQNSVLLKAPTIPKISTEDTTLVIESIHGEKKTIPIQKGTELIISAFGLHYNRKFFWRPDRSYDWLSISARYWKDPHSFKPSRFLEDWPRDAFLPFSVGKCLGFDIIASPWQARIFSGNRACLGRKCAWFKLLKLYFDSVLVYRFFETEGIAILTMMVSKFKIEIKDEPQFRGESFEAKRERVLKTKLGLTVTWAFYFDCSKMKRCGLIDFVVLSEFHWSLKDEPGCRASCWIVFSSLVKMKISSTERIYYGKQRIGEVISRNALVNNHARASLVQSIRK